MELFSVLGIIILIVLALFLGRILSVALRIGFVFLVFALGAMLILGVSFTEVLDWVLDLIVWAF